MRLICAGVLAAAMLSLAGSSAQTAGRSQRGRELEWVKRLTAEFFEVALAPESDREYATSITAYLSPELAAGLKESPPEAAIPKLAWQYQGGAFRLKMGEMAPNGSEAVLKGELIPRAATANPAKAKEEDERARGQAALAKLFTGIDLGVRRDTPAEVTVRVAKDTDGGRWLIRVVRVKLKAGEKGK